MLTVTRHTDYAARIVLHLAERDIETRATAREVADLRGIPPAFVRRIVSRLSAAGILATTRGSGGGITLSRPAHEISLHDIVLAMEGPLSLNGCVAAPSTCEFSANCGVHAIWKGVSRAVEQQLRGATFDRLSAKAPRGNAEKPPKRALASN